VGIALIPLLLLAACGRGDDGGEPEALADPPLGTYVSTSDVQGESAAFSYPVVVKIGEDEITWIAECNTYATSLSIDGDRLVVDGDGESTTIGCTKRSNKQDADLVAFFESDPTWQLDGERLTLSSDEIEVALQRERHPPSVRYGGP